jgi:hypothetical protein
VVGVLAWDIRSVCGFGGWRLIFGLVLDGSTELTRMRCVVWVTWRFDHLIYSHCDWMLKEEEQQQKKAIMFFSTTLVLSTMFIHVVSGIRF